MWEGGGGLYLMQHCHYDNDSKQLTEAFPCFIICAVIITTPCLTIIICAGIITTQYLPITAFEEKGDQTRTRIDSRLLTSLGPYRQAKPADTQSILERVLCPSNRLYIVSALVFRSPLSIKHNPITFYICFLLVFIYFFNLFFYGTLPPHLSSCLSVYTTSRTLCSSSDAKTNLSCSRWKLKGFGCRSFSVQAPLIWNNLPAHTQQCSSLSQFKTSLKTFIFTSAYSDLL